MTQRREIIAILRGITPDESVDVCRALIEAGSPVVADLVARLGGDATALNGPFITEAARDGDATARELLAEIGDLLGVGMANLAAAFDPAMFVIGGGVSAADELLLGPARDAFKRQLPSRGYRPEARIVRAVGSPAQLEAVRSSGAGGAEIRTRVKEERS